jgi:hypothetical protein
LLQDRMPLMQDLSDNATEQASTLFFIDTFQARPKRSVSQSNNLAGLEWNNALSNA